MISFSAHFFSKKRSIKCRDHLFFKIMFLTITVPCLLFAQSSQYLGRASIHPSIVKLKPGEQQKYKVVKMAIPSRPARLADDVKWFVNDIPGGDKKVGFISSDGVYTAPSKVPSPHEIHIIGQVEGVKNRKLLATVLMAPEKPLYKMIREYTEPIKNSKHFTNPHCIAVDKDENLLIADYDGSRLLRFSQDGKYLSDLGSGIGEEPGQIYLPRVVIADKKGDIYVSDQKLFGSRIQVFSNDGKFLRMFADKGTGPGEILRAHGLDFDSQDRLFVIDVDNMRVNIYTHEGEFIKSWGRDGPYRQDFNAPHGLYVDPNDDVFISSYYGAIQKFDADGHFLFQCNESEPPEGSVYVHSISGDHWGNVYAMVRGSRGYGGEVEVTKGKVVSMEKFNNNGDFVGSLSLSVKAHSENWVYVDEKDMIYFIYRSNETMGFEIFAPQ